MGLVEVRDILNELCGACRSQGCTHQTVLGLVEVKNVLTKPSVGCNRDVLTELCGAVGEVGLVLRLVLGLKGHLLFRQSFETRRRSAGLSDLVADLYSSPHALGLHSSGLQNNATSARIEDVPLVEFMYFVFTRMPGESYRSRLWSLLLYLRYVFPALINSLVC